eukprot:TRINITY_DN19278_c0_g1_i1.p1 TRINITY_DN19278_c0_g1~~TRINITY_DN19278_c0_g1_i1.p1  ORF type:complete len:358 (-),score=86.35 TRINITY_DN19278_c0_g1_i1:178-1251(-)
MEILDTDGDRLEFRITATGTLRQYVNGKLEIRDTRSLKYSQADGKVSDDTGVFQLREEVRIEEALGLRILAARCGVVWSGDEPSPASSLVLTDTDGDKLEFVLTEAGKLQELNNGKPELDEVRKLHFDFSSGVVHDDSGQFGLREQHCLQQIAVLYSLAQQAGVEWSGDDPFRPREAVPPKALDIENCDSAWEYKCPKTWESLTPTERSTERFCQTCKETVYFCRTEAELEERTKQRRCVAFDLGTTSQDAAPDITHDATLLVQPVLISGEELPAMRASPLLLVSQLKQQLATGSGIKAAEQRLLHDGKELQDSDSLADAVPATSGEITLQLVKVPKPKPEKIDRPPRRMMGKRRAP